jgi:hypothetical protein
VCLQEYINFKKKELIMQNYLEDLFKNTENLAVGLFYTHRETSSYKCALLQTFAKVYQNVKYFWQWKFIWHQKREFISR